MSVDFDPSKQRWRVRWREDGKQRSRRFATEAEAVAFDNERGAAAQEAPEAEGVLLVDVHLAFVRRAWVPRQRGTDQPQQRVAVLQRPAVGHRMDHQPAVRPKQPAHFAQR